SHRRYRSSSARCISKASCAFCRWRKLSSRRFCRFRFPTTNITAVNEITATRRPTTIYVARDDGILIPRNEK
uniref:Uncharacterized protein n=1 Tax=Haemonchus placei TaxID=6290 RepID=A0A0N4W8R2_HAEPC